jgi:hypothetical protein
MIGDEEKRRTFIEIEDTGPTVWEQFPIASWTVQGSTKRAFPVQSIDEYGGNRLVVRNRPYRPGAKLDDTGPMPKRWTVTVCFENSIEEVGLEENGETPLYPDVMNEILESFDLYHDEPGDLVLPTRGPVRARLETFRRVETQEDRDQATIVFTWIQDNEDNVDANSFQLPSVKANSRRIAEEVEEEMQEDAAWDTSLGDLKEFANNLEGLINAPFEFKQDFEQQAKIAMGAVDDVFTALSDATVDGRGKLNDPETHVAQRELGTMKDMVGRETVESRKARPVIVSVVFREQQSLMSIAAIYGQDYNELMEINSTIADPLNIPAGDVVKVFGDASTS